MRYEAKLIIISLRVCSNAFMNVYRVTTFREKVPGHLRPINWGGGVGYQSRSMQVVTACHAFMINILKTKTKNPNKNTP